MNTKTLLTVALIGGTLYYISTNKKLKQKLGLSGVKRKYTKKISKRKLK